MMSGPRKRKLSPKRSEDLVYKKNTLLQSTRKLHVEKESVHNQKGCTVNVDRFRERIQGKNINAGWLKNFPSDSKNSTEEVPVLNDIRFLFMDSMDLNSDKCQEIFTEHFQSLHMSEEDIHMTEVLTRGQNSQTWRNARQERLTSSHFGSICKRNNDNPPDKLLNAMMYSNFSSSYTEYGKKHEKAARKMYVKFMQQEHRGLQVKENGMFVNKELPYLGSSPDGVVYCSHCEESVGLLEIKCPASMKWRMQTPEKCCEDNNFFCHLRDGCVELKRNHKYYFQVQGQMGVTGRKWCDFVVWTCAGMSVERITFDEKLWKEMLVRLCQFYRDCFIPELFCRRVERGLKLLSSQ